MRERERENEEGNVERERDTVIETKISDCGCFGSLQAKLTL